MIMIEMMENNVLTGSRSLTTKVAVIGMRKYERKLVAG